MLVAWAVVLGGCSSNLNNFGDPSVTGGASISSQARQEPAGTPAPAYPLVHDMPPPRNSVILTDYEQKRLENELIAARRDLHELKDQLWILQCALEDADADLAGSPTIGDYRAALAAIREAAAPLLTR